MSTVSVRAAVSGAGIPVIAIKQGVDAVSRAAGIGGARVAIAAIH